MKRLYILCVIILSMLNMFAQNKVHIKPSSIFGKVAFYDSINIKPIKITLIENHKIIKLDRDGYFYINNLQPGFYNLNIQVEGLNNYQVDSIKVLDDSVTCLLPFYIDKAEGRKIIWNILEYQKNIEPMRYGKIEGYVVEDDFHGKPISNAILYYNQHLWEGKSNSKGYFKINKVIPGHYIMIEANPQHGNYWTRYVGYDVKPGIITKIKLRLFESPQKFIYH
jgi:hypothetical protein